MNKSERLARLKRLEVIDKKIQEIAREFGLDFFPQKFDLISARSMLYLMAYRFPTNFHHWSFGRDYDILRTKFREGRPLPYEAVYNMNPSRAFIMKDMPISLIITTMAHVYTHNDFMKNNRSFLYSRRDILRKASAARDRFIGYERKYGEKAVEEVIDDGMAIQFNINTDLSRPFQTDFKDKPLEPESDILAYIIAKAPLKEWQRDVLSVIWDQSRYMVPQRETIIMNEGWACYWHDEIMKRLVEEKLITRKEFNEYNYWNSQVVAFNPWELNSYLVGVNIWRDIKDRWNKGKFGKEWEECQDAIKKKNWDKKLGKGREKMFQVRKAFTDYFSIDEFLTKEIIDAIKLYIYQAALTKDGKIVPVPVEKNWKKIRKSVLDGMVNFGLPKILLMNGNYKNKRHMYLKHVYGGIPLKSDWREKTTEHIYRLWKRLIHLETVDKIEDGFEGREQISTPFGPIIVRRIRFKEVRRLYTYNGKKHSVKDL